MFKERNNPPKSAFPEYHFEIWSYFVQKKTIPPPLWSSLETGFLGENPINLFFAYFDIFEEKKIFCHFWQKITFFADFEERFGDFPPKLVATASGTGATRFVSVAVNGLRKAEPQLQQRHKQNVSLLQLQSSQGTLLKPLTATEARFAPPVPVAVAVCTKNHVNPTKY